MAKSIAAAEAEKKALIDHLAKPSVVSEEEGIQRGVAIIQRAASNGLTEVEVFRFPNQCTQPSRRDAILRVWDCRCRCAAEAATIPARHRQAQVVGRRAF